MEKRQKRLGIMGGTFNPIHTGHLLLAEWARELYELDHVLIIPTGCSYLKKDSGVLDGKYRLEMAEKAIENNSFFEVSNIEVLREGDTYTYETLLQLKEKYPDEELVFIIGADCLFFIDQWKKAEVILQTCTLLAANRDGVDDSAMKERKHFLEDKYQCHIELLSFPQFDISSSTIRERVKIGKSIKYLVPEAVEKYIYENHLYQ